MHLDGKETYRREDGFTLIEISLSNFQQLFNSLDPAPFHEKDLDSAAEQYIVDAFQELPPTARPKLVFHVPAPQAASEVAKNVEQAIHNYFAYRLAVEERSLRLLMKNGRFALSIAVLFLMLCVALRQLVYALDRSMAQQILAEGLLITGWVAMWRPIEIFLYDWWPIRRICRIYALLGAIPIDIRGANEAVSMSAIRRS